MKKKILIIILIILIALAGGIICVKVFHAGDYKEPVTNDSLMEINPEKKEIAYWICNEKDAYIDNKPVKTNDFYISLLFYEETVEVCVKDEECVEVGYEITGSKLIIDNNEKLSFSGEFVKRINSDTSAMELERDEDNNKVIYYFYKPAGA